MDKLTSANFKQELNNRERWKHVSLKEVEYYICIPYFETKLPNGEISDGIVCVDALGNLDNNWYMSYDYSYYFADGTSVDEEKLRSKMNEFGQLDWTYIKAVPKKDNMFGEVAFFVPIELGEVTYMNYSWDGREEHYTQSLESVNQRGKKHGKGDFLVTHCHGDSFSLESLTCVNGLEFMRKYDLRAFPTVFAGESFDSKITKPNISLMIQKEEIDGSETDKAICHKFCDYIAYLRNTMTGNQLEYRVKHYSMSKMATSEGGFIKAKSCIKFEDGTMYDMQYVIAPTSKKFFSFNKAPIMVKVFSIRTKDGVSTNKVNGEKENLYNNLQEIMSGIVAKK